MANSSQSSCPPPNAGLQPARHLGDLSPVLRLLRSFNSTQGPVPSLESAPSRKSPAALGDFDRILFKLLEKVTSEASKVDDSQEERVFTSDGENDNDNVTAPSSEPEDSEPFFKSREVHFVNADDNTDNVTDVDDPLAVYVAAALRSRSSKSSSKSRRKQTSRKVQKKDSFYNSEFESELEQAKPKPSLRAIQFRVLDRSLTPNQHKESARFALPPYNPTEPPLGWVPPPLNQAFLKNRDSIYPIFTLTATEKRKKLLNKLKGKFDDFQKSTSVGLSIIDRAIVSYRTPSEAGIHVFVDLSNILIGFYDELKRARGINTQTRVPQPPICFENLAMILERGRPTARKILAGSTTTGKFGSHPHNTPHLQEAANCGYELNILERVSKVRDFVSSHRRQTPRNGYTTSSGSEGISRRTRAVMTEQGVDEVLHMKLLETIVDYDVPSTIVLASGDAAKAEYSSGFLKNVVRALEKGWKVEICSWRDGLGQGYRRPEFLEKWKSQFKVIELDDYCEEILAIYTQVYTRDESDRLCRVEADD